jgi:DNA polymerase III sliding clamp (beta) subunit (PCNA family)
MIKTYLCVNHLKAVFNAISNDETRYYLHGVYVEINATATTLVATNGHLLLAAHDETNTLDEPVKLIIPADIVKGFKPARGQKMVKLSTDDGKTWQLGDTLFQPIDGTYPNWRRVVPDQTPDALSIEGAWFEPKYQLALHKAAKELEALCDIHPNGQNPALVQFHDSKNDFPMVGVIMPYRKTRTSFKKPSWA